MSISAGTYTVGGVGTDYPGVTGLNNALADMAATLTGDLTFDVQDNVNLTGTYFFLPAGGYTFKITTTATYHGGNPLIGPVVTVASSTPTFRSGTVSSILIIEKLQFLNNSLYIDEWSSGGHPITATVRNCLFMNCVMVFGHNQGGNFYVYNNLFERLVVWHYGTGLLVVENNTINIAFWIGVLTTKEYTGFTFRNNYFKTISGHPAAPPNWTNPDLSKMPLLYNNASNDTSVTTINWRTGSSGNIGGIVVADEFQSTIVTNPYYYFLKDDFSEILAYSGIAPTLISSDISNRALPDINGDYPIGCHRSEITDFYVNLADAAAAGDGSIVTPFNKTQWLTEDDGTDIISHASIRYLKDQSTVGANNYSITNNADIILKALNLSTYGPASFYSLANKFVVTVQPSKPNALITLRDLVVSANSSFTTDINLNFSTPSLLGNIKNCYFDIYSDYFLVHSNIPTLKFQGCTFVSRLGPFGLDIGGLPQGLSDTCAYEFDDCVFYTEDFFTYIFLTSNGSASTFTFRNCYFGLNYNISYTEDGLNYTDWLVNLGTPPPGYFPVNVTFDANCQWGFDFGANPFPDASTAILATKSTFDYGIFNLPTITDAAIKARWVADDYNTGLFGETRQSLGAFYFPSPVPPVPTIYRYWVAPNINSWDSSNWAYVSGGDSSGVSIPGPANIAIFDEYSYGLCTTDSTVNVGGLILQYGFPSVLSQGNFPIYIGSYDASFIGGEFRGSTHDIVIEGSASFTGTNFKSTRGTLSVRNAFFYTDTTVTPPIEILQTDEYVLANTDIVSKYIALDSPVSDVAVSIGGGSAQEEGVGADFLIDEDILRWDGMVLETKLSVGDILKVTYVASYGEGDFKHRNGKVLIKSTDNRFFGGGIQLYDFEFVNCMPWTGTTTIDSSCYVSHKQYLTSGIITEGTDGTINLTGDMTCSKDFGNLSPANNALIRLIGDREQNVYWDEGGIYPTVTVDKSSSIEVLAEGPGSNLRIGGNFTIQDGTFNLNDHDLLVGL